MLGWQWTHKEIKDNIKCLENARKENNIKNVESSILESALRGTTNLLQSCSKVGSVKRVIFTSSISTITAKDENGEWIQEVNESCLNPANLVWKEKPSGWVYVLSKLLTEQKAFQFAKEKGIDLISIIPPTVAGLFLTPDVPTSLQVLLSPITGIIIFSYLAFMQGLILQDKLYFGIGIFLSF
ncbi:putative dihydroflavanol 4-reductase [Dioscorea sansibarensis]